MTPSETYVGLMSGTSLDGVDAALVDLSAPRPRLLATHYRPFPPELRTALLALQHPTPDELHQAQLLGNELSRHYAQATLELLEKAGTSAPAVRAIGCHGQTVRHRPEAGYTLQLGNAALLAELTGVTVVNDFRSRDIAAGGQGAPLVPAFHDQVLRHPNIHRVVVNIGGISNLSDLPPGRPTTGFDCGPGNMLLDAWMEKHRGEAFDRGGAWAASGTPIPELLQRMSAEPFLLAPPPKSSGRDLFNLNWLTHHLRGNESPVDVQATLLQLSAQAISNAIQRFCGGAQEIYLCGGGAHNHALVNLLHQLLPQCKIGLTDELGIGADWMEAIAFAWLAQQTMRGRSANLPEVTGARHACVLGAIHPA